MVHKFDDLDDAIDMLANRIIGLAKGAIVQRNRFNLVLTGGSSPKKLYKLLATKYRDAIQWDMFFFFIGDERYVPADHPDYNMAMARENLLKPLGIKEDHIFAVNTDLSPADAAADYKQKISDHFDGREIIFDYVLLGMGADAHTASLFPGTTILNATSPSVEAVFVDKLDAWRISMTASMINNAKEIAFLAFGAEKSDALYHVLTNKANKEYPASLIQGNIMWFVDAGITAHFERLSEPGPQSMGL
ncbi:MAG: 6-phosphogluconolactonase [Chitinophagaceae bacterium]|nr:MAG: 6-phosphogluconolactonase [Chitinophagaceae bacterium]